MLRKYGNEKGKHRHRGRIIEANVSPGAITPSGKESDAEHEKPQEADDKASDSK